MCIDWTTLELVTEDVNNVGEAAEFMGEESQCNATIVRYLVCPRCLHWNVKFAINRSFI